MTRNVLLAITVLLPQLAFAQFGDLMNQAKEAAGDSLPTMLSSQLDMSGDQAEGSLGLLMSLAESKLSSGEFDQLASFIPGAAGYVDMAKKLGALLAPLTSLVDLKNGLGRLGIPAETINQFAPTVTDLMGTFSGGDAQKLVGKVLAG